MPPRVIVHLRVDEKQDGWGGEFEDRGQRSTCPVGGKTEIIQCGSIHSFVLFEHFDSLKDEIIIEICLYFVPNHTMGLEIPKNWDFLLISERLILMGRSCIVKLLALTDAVNEENLSPCKVSLT